MAAGGWCQVFRSYSDSGWAATRDNSKEKNISWVPHAEGSAGAGRAAWGVGAGQGCREYAGIVVSDHHAAAETSHIELSTPTYPQGRSVRRN